MNNHVMLIAFNSQIFYQQANLLILSLLTLKWENKIEVHLYTDNESWIPYSIICQIHVYKLTKEEISKMKGEQNFIHRVKIGLIEDLCKKVTGNIIYIDTDCIVTSNFEKIFFEIEKGNFIMYNKEFNFKDPIKTKDDSLKQLSKLLTEDEIFRFDPINLKHNLFDLNYSMWNAGVIGAKSENLSPLFNDIYEITRFIYELTKLHTSEQIAFSIILQRYGTLISSEIVVYHYWDINEKESVNQYISKNLSYLNQLFSKKKQFNKLLFDKFKSKIQQSYIVHKNLSISYFRCNMFCLGYMQFFRAFFKKPLLEKSLLIEFFFHIRRHIRYNIKNKLTKIR